MSLPAIYSPHGHYEEVSKRVLEAVRAATQLDVDDNSDWLVTLCDGWARIAEIIAFYGERIANETFPSTALQAASQSGIAHSLGADLPPRAAAMVTLTYQLSEVAAAVEAAVRARAAGSGATPEELARAGRRRAAGDAPAPLGDHPSGAGGGVSGAGSAAGDGSASGNDGTSGGPGSEGASHVKAQSQVKAIPSSSGHAPVFSTVEPLDAHVSLTQLTPLLPGPPAPAPLAAGATQIELAGTRSGLAVGQPVLIAGADPAAALPLQWIRILTTVQVDQKRASTRIGWETPLGALPGEPPPGGVPSVTSFTASASLVGAGIAPWSTLALATRLAQTTADGRPVAVCGGLASGTDAGATWTAPRSGAPTGRITAVCAASGVVLAAGEHGLIRATDGVTFAAVTLPARGQTVVSLTAAGGSFLAGTDRGALYQSIDGGQSFTQITGGPPRISPPPSSSTTSQVTSFQLPPVAVRCAMIASVAGDPPQLVAGTDRGAFAYDGTNWQQTNAQASSSGSVPPPPPSPLPPILALALHDGQRVGGTPTGVIALDTGGPYGSDLSARVNALTTLATISDLTMPLYAGTDVGVFRLQAAAGQWQPANGDAATPGTISLRGVAVNALVASEGTLFAGTATGVVCSTDGGMTWTPHGDRTLVVSGEAQAVGTVTPGDPAPEGLRTLFAQAGITMPAGTLLTAGASGPQVAVDGRTFALVQNGSEWQVWLCDAMPGIVSLATHAGTLWAAGTLPETVADTWPGFALAGAVLELAPPVKSAVAGWPALIEQQTGAQANALTLSVTAVEQEVVTRFGRRAAVTRLHLDTALDAGTFDRDAVTIWLGGVGLAPFSPPPGAPTQLSGERPVMAGPLAAAIPSGRLAALTGRPVGLTVAPLGGVTRVAAQGAAPLGLAQADVFGVAFDPAGLAFLATSDGVFAVDEPGKEPALLGPGAPAGEAVAVAICATTVLAAFTGGLARREAAPAPGGTPQWEPAGFSGGPVSTLAVDGATAYVLAGDTVYRCDSLGASTPAWSALPAAPQPPRCLAASGGVLWTGTATGVLRCDGDTWTGAATGLPIGAVTAICAMSDGSVLAGSTVGLYRLQAGASAWRREALPLADSSVLALGTDASAEILAVATENGVACLRAGGDWVALPDPPCDAAAVGVAADGSVWVGARAELRLRSADGRRACAALRHRKAFDGVAVQASDITTLSQGGLPPAVSAAFQGAGAALDTAAAVVTTAATGRVWTIRCGGTLSILTTRAGAAGTTFSGFLAQTPATATGPERPASAGTHTWPVELDGERGTLQAPADALVVLAAGKEAPNLSETVRVTRAQTVDRPAGEGTELQLASPLRHVYDAATVTVSLNAVAAAQGRPTTVALGSGDPQQAFQSFTVPTPVAALATSLAAPETQNTSSTLEILVSGEPWSVVTSLLSCGTEDRVYRTRTNSDGSVVVQFGDGVHGARLPAGHNNVVATYLDPGPSSSDVASGRLIQALDRAQMVSGVSNPSAALVPAIADPDRLRLASLRALQRIVTLQDIRDLATAQPGVRVASCELLSGVNGREIVLTVAATHDAALDLEDRVRAVLLAAAAPAPPIRVLAARPVPVRLALSATVDGASAGSLRSAIGGLTAEAPGQPLLASQVILAAVSLTGVIAARIKAWGHSDANPSRASFVAAGGAVRDPRTLVLHGAELLTIDPGLLRIAIEEATGE